MVWVGVDPGEKRLGMARSDPLGIAHPKVIVGSVAELVATTTEWSEERDIDGVVVGLPLNMDGTVGPIAMRSLALVKRLRAELPMDVLLWDERLSSEHVSAGPLGQGKGPIDHRAAAVILQSFLDAGAPRRPDPPEMDSV